MMTDPEALLIRNLLNGVDLGPAARASDMSEEDAETAFGEAMRRVGEYQIVHCVPYFPVNNLVEARRSRLQVLQILDAIADWDNGERALALEILSGRNVIKEGVAREIAERAVNRVLEALPNYLEKQELPVYYRDRMAFIRTNRGRIRELVERFVSFRAPLLHKRIVHATASNFDQMLANIRNV